MAESRDELTVALTGDVMLGRLVNETIAERGFAYPWGDMLARLRHNDLLLINLECAITPHDERWHDGQYKEFYFRADPEAVQALSIAGVRFASLANNHAGDFETRGLVDTIETLDRAGIAHAGAGRNLGEAKRPAIVEAKGTRIGIVAFADYPEKWKATHHSPGLNYIEISTKPGNFQQVEEAIQAARRSADFVFFCIHWGPNMRDRPTPEFRQFAHAVIAAGADVFWGHSAHVVQGIEVFRGRPILYDTGDFVDDYRCDPVLRNDLSALFVLRYAGQGLNSIEFIPVKIGEMQVNLASGATRNWIYRRIGELSAPFGTVLRRENDRLLLKLR